MADKPEKKKKPVKRAPKPKPPKKAATGTAKNYRDIGVEVSPPSGTCDDVNCPFHGTLSVRGQILEGIVVSDRMQGTVIVKKDHRRYIPKYERFELRTGRYAAHNPPCIAAKIGSKVRIMECRPLSKTKSFVVIEQRT